MMERVLERCRQIYNRHNEEEQFRKFAEEVDELREEFEIARFKGRGLHLAGEMADVCIMALQHAMAMNEMGLMIRQVIIEKLDRQDRRDGLAGGE
jgi:hypothetical protein